MKNPDVINYYRPIFKQWCIDNGRTPLELDSKIFSRKYEDLLASGEAKTELEAQKMVYKDYSQVVSQFARERGFNGIWYESAQLPGGNACCLFEQRTLDVSKWEIFLGPVPLRLGEQKYL